MSNASQAQGISLSIKVGSAYVHIAEIKDFSAFGGSAAVIDITNLDSQAKEKLMGLQDFGQVTFNFNHIASDAGQVALETAKASRLKQDFNLTLTDTPATTYSFSAFVLSKGISGGVEQAVSGSCTVEITGEVTSETAGG